MGSPRETPTLASSSGNGPYCALAKLVAAAGKVAVASASLRHSGSGSLVLRGDGGQHRCEFDLWPDAHPRPGPGPRPGSFVGVGRARRATGSTDRAGGRGQPGSVTLGQGSGQPQLFGEPDFGGLVG